MGGGPAHSEEGAPFQREDLPTHKVDDVGAEEVNLTTVPFLDGVFGKSGEVFMVSVHKGDCERQILEKHQLDFVSSPFMPQAAESPQMIMVSAFVMALISGKRSGLNREKFLWVSPVT